MCLLHILYILVYLLAISLILTTSTPYYLVKNTAFYIPIYDLFYNDAYPNYNMTLEYMLSIKDMADIPSWMFYSQHGFIYGSPVRKEELIIEIVALNKVNYDTLIENIELSIDEIKESVKYEVELKIMNLNVEEMFNRTRWNNFLSIFTDHIWKYDDVHLSFIASPIDIKAKLPMNPKDKDGVFIRIGSHYNFSQDLLDLEREIEPIKNRDPCPKKYKHTRVEYRFRNKDFIIDWCSFKLIKRSLENEPLKTNIESIMQDYYIPENNTDFLNGSSSRYIMRNYNMDIIYCLLIPTVIVCLIISILSSIFFHKEGISERKSKDERMEMIRYSSIQKSTHFLRTFGSVPSSPSTITNISQYKHYNNYTNSKIDLTQIDQATDV